MRCPDIVTDPLKLAAWARYPAELKSLICRGMLSFNNKKQAEELEILKSHPGALNIWALKKWARNGAFDYNSPKADDQLAFFKEFISRDSFSDFYGVDSVPTVDQGVKQVFPSVRAWRNLPVPFNSEFCIYGFAQSPEGDWKVLFSTGQMVKRAQPYRFSDDNEPVFLGREDDVPEVFGTGLLRRIPDRTFVNVNNDSPFERYILSRNINEEELGLPFITIRGKDIGLSPDSDYEIFLNNRVVDGLLG